MPQRFALTKSENQIKSTNRSQETIPRQIVLERTATCRDSRLAQQLPLSPWYSAVSSNTQRASPALQPGPRLQQALISISRQAERDIEMLSLGASKTRIHALRVRMKKLGALLQLLKQSIAPGKLKTIRGEVRALKEAFAMNRDQQVMNALLVKLRKDKVARHNDRLVPGNGMDGAVEMPGPSQFRRIQATARALTGRLQTMNLRSLVWDDVATSYAHRYAKAREWFRRCGHKASAERLHRWRKLVKDHYLQSLMLLRHRPHLKATRKLGSLLGRMHDLAMLRESFDCGTSNHLGSAITRLLKELQTRSFRKGRQIFVPSRRKIKHQVREVLRLGRFS